MEKFNDELNRVICLIERGETLLDWSYTLSGMYEKGLNSTKDKQKYLTNNKNMLIVLQTNLFFQDSLLCIHSALLGDTKENKEEIGLPYVWLNYKDEIKSVNDNFLAKLERAQKIYKDNNLDIIRNKIVAHKDLQTSGDAIMGFMNRFQNIHLGALNECINTLKSLVLGFDVPQNNGFRDFYTPAFLAFIDIIKPDEETRT